MRASVGVFGLVVALGACASTDRGGDTAAKADTAGAGKAATDNASRPRQSPVRVFYIELEGGRDSTERIGCGDRAVGVPLDTLSKVAPLRRGIQSLLDARGSQAEGGKLYNALGGMSLKIDSVAIRDSNAVIGLSGQFSFGGVCDAPRIEAQLMRTAMQFSSVRSATFFVNGKPLREMLSER